MRNWSNPLLIIFMFILKNTTLDYKLRVDLLAKRRSLSGFPAYYFPNIWGSEQNTAFLLFFNWFLHIDWYYLMRFLFLQKGGKAAQLFCKSYFLSSSVMYMIRYNLSHLWYLIITWIGSVELQTCQWFHTHLSIFIIGDFLSWCKVCWYREVSINVTFNLK